MKIVNTSDTESVLRAAEVLRAGGVIVYPTDTAYGLGADATNPEAVEKIFAIKGREAGKPIPVIVGSVEDARKYVAFSLSAEKLTGAFWPGALTLILPAPQEGLAQIIRGAGTVGIRIPNHAWCQAIALELGRPITSTSANMSGTSVEYSLAGVEENLGAVGENIDLWVDGGELSGGPVSTVVRVEGEEVMVKREGAISGEDLKKVLE